MKKEKFNKIKYNIEYSKRNYKKFACDLKHEEYNNLNELLKEKNMNKAEFVRWAYNKLKK